MEFSDNLNINSENILFYNSVASVAMDSSKRVANELTPSFIIHESIQYFSSKEEYETCMIIKNFYDNNPSFFVEITREEWFMD